MGLEYIGPVGKIAKGHVLDCRLKPFERALQAYDPDLYVKWNPKKVKGHGCWEIRRHNPSKEVVQVTNCGPFRIIKIDYHENDIVNHVLDCAFLNYDALRKIKEMDTWEADHWIHDIDNLEEARCAKIKNEAKDALKYNLKQNRRAMKEFMNLVNSGHNPADILLSTKWVLK